ncbi:MAG: DUF3429 domain-containing protein [Pseudomonadota bacterium]
MADRTVILAYAGTLPFIAGAALTVLGTDLSVLGPALEPVPVLASAWALTIVSFMAGVHWGQYLVDRERIGIDLFLTSNAIAIAGWLAFLLLPTSHALLAFTALFGILLLIDGRLHGGGHITAGYWRARLGVTAIVVAALLVTAVSA